MNYQRHAIGCIAIAFLAAGGYVYFFGNNLPIAGIFSRVGFLLLVIWLAYPQLDALKSRLSFGLLLMLLAALVVIAIRPRLVILAVGLLVVGFLVNGALRRLASSKR